jgi:pyruvate dehydrogenase E2 component (dihydrolipoamide acetyltransferase)
VRQIRVKVGDSVAVGQTILTLEEGAAADQQPEPKEAQGPAQKKEAARRATKPKDREAAAERPAQPKEQRKESPAPEQTAPPRRRQSRPAESEEAPEESGRKERPTAPELEEQQEEDSGAGASAAASERDSGAEPVVAAGPATRRLARELAVDLRKIAGSDPGGRITEADVKAFVRDASGATHRPAPLPDFERWGEIERRKLSKLGRTAAERLTIAWRTIPHVTQHDFADITELEAARRRYEAGRGEYDPKLTVTVLAIKAVVAALKAFPQFNSSFDEAAGELIIKHYYHIGVAVDTENGLLVPVLRDADQRTTKQLAAELERLAQRARERKLTSEDMQGGTFTVTNLGGIGGSSFTPIVNYPEVAILGLSRAQREQARPGATAELLRLPLSLSYDHRVINGADAARFVRHLVELLQDPLHLLMES